MRVCVCGQPHGKDKGGPDPDTHAVRSFTRTPSPPRPHDRGGNRETKNERRGGKDLPAGRAGLDGPYPARPPVHARRQAAHLLEVEAPHLEDEEVRVPKGVAALCVCMGGKVSSPWSGDGEGRVIGRARANACVSKLRTSTPLPIHATHLHHEGGQGVLSEVGRDVRVQVRVAVRGRDEAVCEKMLFVNVSEYVSRSADGQQADTRLHRRRASRSER